MLWLKNQPWNTSPTRAQVAAEIEWNLWSNRQPPFNDLDVGHTVYLVTRDGSPRGVISWMVEVTGVTAVPYSSKRDAWVSLHNMFGSKFGPSVRDFLSSDYAKGAPDSGWLLAWDYRPVRRVGLPRPGELKFRPNGWLQLDGSDPRLTEWGIPT